jgi:hypothetical protein
VMFRALSWRGQREATTAASFPRKSRSNCAGDSRKVSIARVRGGQGRGWSAGALEGWSSGHSEGNDVRQASCLGVNVASQCHLGDASPARPFAGHPACAATPRRQTDGHQRCTSPAPCGARCNLEYRSDITSGPGEARRGDREAQHRSFSHSAAKCHSTVELPLSPAQECGEIGIACVVLDMS